ncbi:MAG: glycogen synthase [Clostridia bacterium]|nr:glycogen synthase [Clostridia bacterium]
MENKNTKILIVGSEALPFAATGGLGDVLGSLPAALAREAADADIRVVMPLYKKVGSQYREKMTKVAEFNVRLAWRNLYCGIYSLTEDGVIYYFIDNEYYFKRPSLYGDFDDGERFAFFSRAVMDMIPVIDFYPNVLHANDWQSALTVIYNKLYYKYPGMKTIYTIHNIEYQGKYDKFILGDVFGIDNSDLSVVEYDGCINLTKGAIVCCDKLTTVSSRYADEIKDAFFAHGLENIIRANAEKLSGIVNGIDYDYYNPMTLENKFSASYRIFSGKAKNKAALQEMLGLPTDTDAPVVSMISRLASHKGFDLVKCVIEEALNTSDMQFVLLGTGEEEFEGYFADLASRYPSRVRALFEFNKELSKKIYAGSDIFLMPSKSEPCGLSQMIASRYATVPIVRETGGLYDTIQPFNPETLEGNGVTFCTYNAHDMLDAINRTLALYNNKNVWKKLVKNAAEKDFSWNASARLYLLMYAGL